MVRFITRRLVTFVVTLFASSIAIFLMVRLAGGNVAAVIIGKGGTPAAIQALQRSFGLDRPLVVQYWDWLRGVLTGDLGRSFRTKSSVSSLIFSGLPISVPLAAAALVLAIVIALVVGTYAARGVGRWSGAIVGLFSQIGIAVPAFWAGLLLSLLVGVKLGWLPTGGWTPWSTSFTGAIKSLILPVLSLALVMAASMSRYVRTMVLDVMNEDYVRTARAYGMTRTRALISVGLRNAALPLITVLGLQIGELVGGTVIVEQVFSLPGLSRMILSNVTAQEVTVVQSTVMLIVAFVMIINLGVDLLYGVLDPRVRIAR